MAEDTSGYVRMISPQDYRVYRVPSAQSQVYEQAGYTTTSSAINREEIAEHFKGVAGAGHSFLISTLAGVPFAKSLIAGVSTAEGAKAWKEDFDAAAREHPYLDLAGRTVGTVGTIAGVAATAGALGTLGAGAAAAAEGVGAAEAAGAGLASAEGLAGAATAGEAAAAAEPGLMSLAAPTIRGAAIKGAATNATLGHIARIDDSALAHAADPAGKEKIVWGLNGDDLLDAAIGAALPATLGVAGKTLGFIGKKLDTKGMKIMQSALTDASKMDAVERQGRMGEVRSKLDTVIQAGRKDPSAFVKSQIKIVGNDLEDLKAAIKYKALDEEKTYVLQRAMRKALGEDNRIYRRLAKELQLKTWTVDDMQKINQKIYAEIEHAEPGLRSEMDAKFVEAAELVKKGMADTFEAHDFSIDKKLAQKWMTAMKEYSEWQLVNSVMKRGKGPLGAQGILSNIFKGGATGFLGGSILGAFGGPLNAASNSASLAAVHSIDTFHYGKAATLIAKMFNHIDSGLTSAVESGLWGVPSQFHQFRGRDKYEDVASKISAAAHDPLESFTHLRTALSEKGVPEHIGDDVALAQHAQVQWLASKIPKRMTAPDIASKGHGDPVQQRRFLGQVQTVLDPTHGIRYPTKTNMEVLQRFYPNALYNAQQAVLSQLQRNTSLPSASKLWASRILGRPMNNLSSPGFSSMIQQARAKSAEDEAQGQKMGSAQRPRTNSDSNGATRLDQLQGADS